MTFNWELIYLIKPGMMTPQSNPRIVLCSRPKKKKRIEFIKIAVCIKSITFYLFELVKYLIISLFVFNSRLACCGFRRNGCSSLVSALKSNPGHLRELDLSYNLTGSEALTHLLALLPNCRLDTLR